MKVSAGRILVLVLLGVIVGALTANARSPFSHPWNEFKKGVGQGARNLDPRTQARNSFNLAKAVVSGNPQKAEQALGTLLLQSPNCLGCEQLAHVVVPQLSTDQIDKIAGQGALTFVGTQATRFLSC
jgi:hypothetical protein